jgi:plasmid stabilization system protein ParE
MLWARTSKPSSGVSSRAAPLQQRERGSARWSAPARGPREVARDENRRVAPLGRGRPRQRTLRRGRRSLSGSPESQISRHGRTPPRLMRFRFSCQAKIDIAEIGDYIARDNPTRAVSFVPKLHTGASCAVPAKAAPLRPEFGEDVRMVGFGPYSSSTWSGLRGRRLSHVGALVGRETHSRPWPDVLDQLAAFWEDRPPPR